MNILAIEPYYDGSHKAFIDGWIGRSRHSFHLLTMPGLNWKWRMRGAAMEIAKQANSLIAYGCKFDVIFCCDMLNFAEFAGLLRPELAILPKVVYFHENQLTYPCPENKKRDYSLGITNITTAAAATEVWFNSAYHRDDFLNAAKPVLARMPDYNCLYILDDIRAKSLIAHPPITAINRKLPDKQGKLKIIWAARWEHDKNPEDFFKAINLLSQAGVDFELNVVGQAFNNTPEIFDKAKTEFADKINFWGYLPSAKDYGQALCQSDVFVSTAIHEFFGISSVEAASAGCCVLLPDRLAYPEVFNKSEEFLYDGGIEDLAEKLANLAGNRNLLIDNAQKAAQISKKYLWKENAARMDNLIAKNFT